MQFFFKASLIGVVVQGYCEAQSIKQMIIISLMFMIYPILVLLSPLIMLMIKIQSVLRPNHEFIKKQAKQASLGESILESTPQYCLQLFAAAYALLQWPAG